MRLPSSGARISASPTPRRNSSPGCCCGAALADPDARGGPVGARPARTWARHFPPVQAETIPAQRGQLQGRDPQPHTRVRARHRRPPPVLRGARRPQRPVRPVRAGVRRAAVGTAICRGTVCTALQGTERRPGRLTAVFKFARQQGTPLAWCLPYGLDAPKKVRRCPVPVPRGLDPAQNRGGQHFAQG